MTTVNGYPRTPSKDFTFAISRIKKGFDPYRAFAAARFGKYPDEATENERMETKIRILAALYGAKGVL